jgi:hypothetical protein
MDVAWKSAPLQRDEVPIRQRGTTPRVVVLCLSMTRWARLRPSSSPTCSQRYHAIASNRPNEDAAVTMEWYSERGDASENRIKDLKVGFGMEYMPCGSFQSNAVFFAARSTIARDESGSPPIAPELAHRSEVRIAMPRDMAHPSGAR